jgi:phosphoglycerate dehydrogenase-like enzyme
VVIPPHSAFYTKESREEMRVKAAQEIQRILLGEKPRNVMNQEFLKERR